MSRFTVVVGVKSHLNHDTARSWESKAEALSICDAGCPDGWMYDNSHTVIIGICPRYYYNAVFGIKLN